MPETIFYKATADSNIADVHTGDTICCERATNDNAKGLVIARNRNGVELLARVTGTGKQRALIVDSDPARLQPLDSYTVVARCLQAYSPARSLAPSVV